MKNRPPPKNYCRSFKPFVDRRARVLILGSMPGPEALRKQQFYGFSGNHFWTILPTLFNRKKPEAYSERLAMLRANRVALWDVLESCVRPGALDSLIREAKTNPIPDLLKKYPNIRAVFINGGAAHKIFMRAFGREVRVPVHRLPSTSPAHAAMRLEEKTRKWSIILEYIKNKKPGFAKRRLRRGSLRKVLHRHNAAERLAKAKLRT